MSLLEIPAGRVAYDETGSGETIVMLSSGAHDRHDYDELRALIPARLRTVALDWPGHGDSPPGTAPGSAMRLADVAEQAIERLAPEGAIVIGNSVGGFCAARLAIRRPDLVKGLVIIDGGGFAGRGPRVRAFCALMAQPWFLRAVYPAFSRLYMRPRTAADRRARDRSVGITRSDPGLRAVSELWGSFASPEHDLRGQSALIAAPTLLIWGRRDPVIPLKIGRSVAATIRRASLAVIDSGHVPQTTDPQAVAAHLMPFLDEALAERAAQPAMA